MQAVVRFELTFFLGALLLALAMGLLSGSIHTRGLLESFDGRTWSFSPGRLQLLIVTLLGAASYLVVVVTASGDPALAEPPLLVLLGVGASNLGYLGGKIHSLLIRPRLGP